MDPNWFLKDNHTGQTYAVPAEGLLTIGRSSKNRVTLKNSSVSRYHAQIVLDTRERLYVQDLNSANGTFVNKKRVIGTQLLGQGDQLHIGSHSFSVDRGGIRPAVKAEPGTYRKPAFNHTGLNSTTVIVASVVVVIILLVTMVYINRVPGQVSPAASAPEATVIVMEATVLSPQAARERALAAVVLIATPSGWGSGSIVDSRGYILTNAHVVSEADAGPALDLVDIYLNPPGANDLPRYEYMARLVDYDRDLDLALLKVVADKNGHPLPDSELDLVTVPLGNPHDLGLQDVLTVIGFPGTGIGGPSGRGSVTVTTGTVAGFENSLGVSHAWIKTDAEISAGNSGGMALNQNYELVGIPTIVKVDPKTIAGKIGYIHSIEIVEPMLSQIPPLGKPEFDVL